MIVIENSSDDPWVDISDLPATVVLVEKNLFGNELLLIEVSADELGQKYPHREWVTAARVRKSD